jgi:FkbM family methyltransferase
VKHHVHAFASAAWRDDLAAAERAITVSAYRTTLSKAVDSLRFYYRLFGAKGVVRRVAMMLPGVGNDLSVSFPESGQRLALRLGTTDVGVFMQVFVYDQYGVGLARAPSVIVDAGANVGMSAVYFAQRHPDAKIIAIEPEPENFRLLVRNARPFPNIVPVQAALWNHDGTVAIHDTGRGGWGMRVAEDAAGAAVKSIRLDTLLRDHGITHVDLLKVDIEGAECEVFEDAATWIDRVSVVCTELHDGFRPGCSEIFERATNGFPLRWQRGELTCVARSGEIVSQ